jgi:CDP-diacylglycerol---glycerol-3-phosphate 3-phosphatidyltransferase
VANYISLLRVILALVVCGLLFIPSQTIYWWAFGLTIVVIWMDGLDGYVARKFNETSKAGAVIDILGDRIVEQAYWVTFLALGWVPLWVPLLVIVRGIVVDGLRSLALEQGYTAFGSSSLMQHPLGILLVSSRFSRWTYAVVKAIAFCLLIVSQTPDLPVSWLLWLTPTALACVYVTMAFCLIRGLPVLIEARRFF